jgi:hypothetical protein
LCLGCIDLGAKVFERLVGRRVGERLEPNGQGLGFLIGNEIDLGAVDSPQETASIIVAAHRLAYEYRKLVAHKFDGSKDRRGPGRPRVTRKVEQLIVRLAEENRDWGYDRIGGALANLGYRVCDQTVGNVLQRHGLPPAPQRKRTTTWSAFIRTHLALLAGTEFFTAEVLTLRELMTYYVLFFIHLESRRVDIAGITIHPNEPWMKQIARNRDHGRQHPTGLPLSPA